MRMRMLNHSNIGDLLNLLWNPQEHSLIRSLKSYLSLNHSVLLPRGLHYPRLPQERCLLLLDLTLRRASEALIIGGGPPLCYGGGHLWQKKVSPATKWDRVSAVQQRIPSHL